MKKIITILCLLGSTCFANLTPISGVGGVTSVNTQTGVVVIPTASAAASGLLSSTDWSTFDAKQTALLFNSPLQLNAGNNLTVTAMPVGLNGSPLSDTGYWVDGSRTDVYTQDGSFARPYKAIQGCINRIIANNDNSPSNLEGCRILGPYIYRENVTLESLALQRIYILGMGATQGVVIAPNSGDALRSISNNNNLKELFIDNLRIIGPSEFIGDTNGSTFLDVNGAFMNITFDEGSSPITVKNVVDFEMHGGNQTSDISVENVDFFEIDHGSGFTGNLSVVTNLSHNQPDGFSTTTAILESITATGNMTCDSGSLLQLRGGTRGGSSGGSLTSSGTLQLYNSFVRSNIVNTGSMVVRGGMYKSGNLSGSGSVTNDVGLDQFKSFVSSTQTGNGATQSLAHGLGYVPQNVLIMPVTIGPSGYSALTGVQSSSNVNVTVTPGAQYKVFAF